ncbi:hypothetical protein SAMN05421856_1215 [Chryseobacterium taichungense]|uniref:Uncharacterized protein n=1 Tax=Chryseobacterium taichungense TaxID=295069 RepID=A0A1H8DX80_9FLAO|nr:hypothetical protein SAMN05421856_1215 [Chryseobacterium taichungense]
MGIFEYIFQQIFMNIIGNGIYYLLRKIIGDKRSYKEIQDQTEGYIKFFTGVIFVFIIIVLMKKFIK